ncbi:MAG TPA: NAD(P)-dependent oxidoreductase, partial [Dehalococcoidia bacterium]|nr:NAD(P)-dependent oxidoreductase [Dehalococcoidia bacterium]
MAKILVTGGLGTVGKPLTHELNRRGHEVWVADRFHCHEPNYMRCDVAEFHQVERLFSETMFDYVYHLAAEFGRRNGEDFYESLWKTNAIGTKNIIRMQERLKFRMVFTSSSEVYGDYSGVMSEDVTDKVPVKHLNDYAMSKWVNEMQILNSASMFSTETVRVRLFNTYGPGEYYSEYRSAICIFIYRALHNLPYTVYTKHKRTSSYIDDTVRTLANIIDNFKPGEVYNVAGNYLHDMRRVSDIILSYLGKDDSLVKYRDT